jgi:hypothetical protein
LLFNHNVDTHTVRSINNTAASVVMASNEGADVAKAMKAVRKAYDDLQALRTSHDFKIPLLLLVASTALDKLSCNLKLIAGSVETLARLCTCSLKEASTSPGTSLSNALVHDMEAIARHFRLMTPATRVEITGDLDEGECRDIVEMVDRYDRAVFSVLVQRSGCVQDRQWYLVLIDVASNLVDLLPGLSQSRAVMFWKALIRSGNDFRNRRLQNLQRSGPVSICSTC